MQFSKLPIDGTRFPQRKMQMQLLNDKFEVPNQDCDVNLGPNHHIRQGNVYNSAILCRTLASEGVWILCNTSY